MFAWWENLHSLVQFCILFGIAAVIAFPLSFSALWLWYSFPRVIQGIGEMRESKLRRKDFKRHFKISIDWQWFSKDTSYKSWKDKYSKQQLIIQRRIDKVLPQLEKDFRDVCKEEDKLMEPYYWKEGEKRQVKAKEDLKELDRIQRKISLAEIKFQNARNVAGAGGFKIGYGGGGS